MVHSIEMGRDTEEDSERPSIGGKLRQIFCISTMKAIFWVEFSAYFKMSKIANSIE